MPDTKGNPVLNLTPDGLLDVPRAHYVATCRTPGCHNEGIPLTVPADVHEQVIVCGPCRTRITDVTPAPANPEGITP
jgi:hypothetical protein